MGGGSKQRLLVTVYIRRLCKGRNGDGAWAVLDRFQTVFKLSASVRLDIFVVNTYAAQGRRRSISFYAMQIGYGSRSDAPLPEERHSDPMQSTRHQGLDTPGVRGRSALAMTDAYGSSASLSRQVSI